MQKIESPQNDTFKTLLSLTTSKGLKAEGLFLLSGEKLIGEFLRRPHLGIAYELTTPAMTPFVDPVQAPGMKSVQFSSELFAQLDVVGTHSNILVLEQPPIEILEAGSINNYAAQGLEVVIPVGDPGNLGALIRSCEAFSVPRVILTSEAAHPFLPKTVKASAGSVLRMPMTFGPPLSQFPDACIALDMDGTPLADFIWPMNGLLVVGEEGVGIDAQQFSQRVRIPTQGVESLNAVVAASIALAHRAMQK